MVEFHYSNLHYTNSVTAEISMKTFILEACITKSHIYLNF